MAIEPINNNAVNQGEIIKASDLRFTPRRGKGNSLGYPVYDNKDTLSSTIGRDDNLYFSSNFNDLISDINNNISNEIYNIKTGQIVIGDNTYDWIKYGYENLSHIRWCNFFYYNTEYKYKQIFSGTHYTKSTSEFVLLNPAKYVCEASTNGVHYGNKYTNFIKIEPEGKYTRNNYTLSKCNLDTDLSVDKPPRDMSKEYKKLEIISSDTINTTVTKYNRFLLQITNDNSLAPLLSCTFSNAPGFRCKDDNYDMHLHFALFLKEDWSTIEEFAFNFKSSSTLLSLNEFNSLKGDGYGEANSSKYYKYDIVEFSLDSLGIDSIKFTSYTISGWYCVRTNSDDVDTARSVLNNYVTVNGTKVSITNPTDNLSNDFQHYTYKSVSENNFDTVKNTPVYVNLGNRENNKNHYWIFPKMSGEKIEECYCPLNNYAIKAGTSNYKKNTVDAALGVMHGDADLNYNENDKCYGIYHNGSSWNYITSNASIDTCFAKYPYDTYLLSSIYVIHADSDVTAYYTSDIFEKPIKVNNVEYIPVKYIRDGFDLRAAIYNKNGDKINTITLVHDEVDTHQQHCVAKKVTGVGWVYDKTMYYSSDAKNKVNVNEHFKNLTKDHYVQFRHNKSSLKYSTKVKFIVNESIYNAVVKSTKLKHIPHI